MILAKCTSTPRQGYYSAAFAFVLYGGLLLAKILVYESGTPLSPNWKWLAILNVIEACGWVWWILARHGLKFGPVLLLLPLLCFFYSTVPVSLLAMGLNIYPFSDAVVRSGMYMQSLMETHLWLFCAVMFSAKQSKRLVERINGWFDALYITPTGIWLFILSGLAIAVVYLVRFYTSGAASLVGEASRLELVHASETGKTWLIERIFACWLMVCAALCNSKKVLNLLKFRHISVAVISIIIFMYAYITLGNRSEVSSVIVFICIVLFLRGRVWQVIGIVALCVPALVYISLNRSGDALSIASMSPVEYYLGLLGEFVFPHYPLLDHIAFLKNYWFGSSYVTWIAEWIPTFWLWNKPMSIGIKFATDMGGVGGMGYAYTPLGEGYANFGAISVLIVPLYLSAWMRILASERFATPLPFLLFASISANISRGTFGAVAGLLLMVTIIMYWFIATAQTRLKVKIWNNEKVCS